MEILATIGTIAFAYSTYLRAVDNMDPLDFKVLFVVLGMLLFMVPVMWTRPFPAGREASVMKGYLTCIVMATALVLTPSSGLPEWIEDASNTDPWILAMFLSNVIMPLSFFAAVLAFLLLRGNEA